MNIDKVRYLREILVTDGRGKTTVIMEFSYDDRFAFKHRFFGVPDDQRLVAQQLYGEWGGSRLEGYRRGTTAGRP
jgi:hypothetical protein